MRELKPLPRQAKDISGLFFGRLQAIAHHSQTKDKKSRWLCLCECGTFHISNAANLHQGSARSCGCLKDESLHSRNLIHGLSKTKEFRTWVAIIGRCRNPNSKDAPRYSARGIKVCERWRNSFQSFLDDMGKAPSSIHSIERKNNNGDYEPSNCVWATMRDQSNNRRSNRLLLHQGQILTVSQWARKLGIWKTTIKERLNRGWTIAEALSPVIK